jgi:hypothetical protein
LGPDAEKILDHRLFSVNTVRETSAWKREKVWKNKIRKI